MNSADNLDDKSRCSLRIDSRGYSILENLMVELFLIKSSNESSLDASSLGFRFVLI